MEAKRLEKTQRPKRPDPADPSVGSETKRERQSTISADQPIEEPAQDLFGYDPFARSIATGIAGMTMPEGIVVGLHGPWGSGKSSAVNLVRHHLGSGGLEGAADLAILQFNPWWFTGADALAMAFFAELSAAIGKDLPAKARAALRTLGRRLGTVSPLIGAAVNAMTLGTAGGAAEAASKVVGDALDGKRTVVEEQAVLSQALRKGEKRYLVIIDDLDRLSADEALLVFKLVKSVGRLPNVIYLMVFDRALTEAAVAEKFPSEGAHFLEKIIQASFELPPPEPDDLRALLVSNVARIMGQVDEARLTRFWNVFYDAVAPHIARARDVVRLTNALEVTWPAVRQDADIADFLAVETLRLFRPGVHRAIFENADVVCGPELGPMPQGNAGETCDQTLLADIPANERPALRKALMRLFPALESAWSNVHYDRQFAIEWRTARRVCVRAHFDTYFRFSPSDRITPAAELETFVARAGNAAFVAETMRQALATPRRRGGTAAAVLLDELAFRADAVAPASVGPLLETLFGMADELLVTADEARGMSIGDNGLRLHFIVSRLIRDRLEPARREAILEAAFARATLIWSVDFALRCLDEHNTEKSGGQQGEPLVGADCAERLRVLALDKVEAAEAAGTLVSYPDLVSRLFRWRDLIGGGGEDRVGAWVGDRLGDQAMIVNLARSSVSHGWSHVAGDAVSRRYQRFDRAALEKLVNLEAFRGRVAGMLAGSLSDEDRQVLTEFEKHWAHSEQADPQE